MTLQNN